MSGPTREQVVALAKRAGIIMSTEVIGSRDVLVGGPGGDICLPSPVFSEPRVHAASLYALECFAALAYAAGQAAEREECAKVCEELAEKLLECNWSAAQSHQAAGAEDCAAAIRSRNNK